MSTIELYNVEEEAIGARDHYNHNLDRRAVVALVPSDTVEDYGGGPADRIFQNEVELPCWMLLVED